MKNTTKRITGALSVLVLLAGCSSTTLHTKRLNIAEDQINYAEQVLSQSPSSEQIKMVSDELGTATAYLATVEDFKKFLSNEELRRHKALLHRANTLLGRIQVK